MRGSPAVVTALVVSCLATTGAFVGRGLLNANRLLSPRLSMSSNVPAGFEEPNFDSVIVSGFVSKENNVAEPFVFTKLYESGKWSEITTVTDDLKFARKRFVNPTTVYSGLIDFMQFAEVNSNPESSMETALRGKDAWVSFNITAADLPVHADLAAKLGLKRAVFAVNVGADAKYSAAGATFDDVCAKLSAANVAYTIIKFGPVTEMAEAKFPYRIVRGPLALPTEGQMLSSGDLMRVSSAVCLIMCTRLL
jgi:hypothetical protein